MCSAPSKLYVDAMISDCWTDKEAPNARCTVRFPYNRAMRQAPLQSFSQILATKRQCSAIYSVCAVIVTDRTSIEQGVSARRV